MNKKSTANTAHAKPKKLKLIKQTLRDLTAPDEKTYPIRGGRFVPNPTSEKPGCVYK